MKDIMADVAAHMNDEDKKDDDDNEDLKEEGPTDES